MSVHHIHPHVMGHHDHQQHRNFHFDKHHDIFKNLDQVFHNGTGPTNNGHSFTATYSNHNGHVTKHFSQDGQTVNADHAQQMMKQMHQSMKNMDQMFDNDLDWGNFDHFGHNLDHMIGSHHSAGRQHRNPFQRLANHFKK